MASICISASSHMLNLPTHMYTASSCTQPGHSHIHPFTTGTFTTGTCKTGTFTTGTFTTGTFTTGTFTFTQKQPPVRLHVKSTKICTHTTGLLVTYLLFNIYIHICMHILQDVWECCTEHIHTYMHACIHCRTFESIAQSLSLFNNPLVGLLLFINIWWALSLRDRICTWVRERTWCLRVLHRDCLSLTIPSWGCWRVCERQNMDGEHVCVIPNICRYVDSVAGYCSTVVIWLLYSPMERERERIMFITHLKPLQPKTYGYCSTFGCPDTSVLSYAGL